MNLNALKAAPTKTGTIVKPKPKRKPRAPHPSNIARSSRKKLPPPLPPRPLHPSKSLTQPIKTAQGLRTRRNDTTHPGFGREVIFVTRSTGLGLLTGRCRSLVVDEGHTMIRLHAISAAIPQALLLLHALMDILPYPKGEKGMWYELRTGSVECVDEISKLPSRGDTELRDRSGRSMDVDMMGGLENIGRMEEDEPERHSRIKSSIQIDLHISPRPGIKDPSHPKVEGEKRRNRPSKRQREALSKQRGSAQNEEEEAMINAQVSTEDIGTRVIVGGIKDDEEEEEQIEHR